MKFIPKRVVCIKLYTYIFIFIVLNAFSIQQNFIQFQNPEDYEFPVITAKSQVLLQYTKYSDLMYLQLGYKEQDLGDH